MEPLIPGAGVISGMGLLALAGWVWKIWKNDLKHVKAALERIETKLDQHINDHAKGDL